ncbi:MAG: Bro-N domain-containing protein, partial [Treponema sp.]|nr:Bro-N domain-containing protein [Treponema sp.]
MDKSVSKIKLFEEQQVRYIWDEEAEKWWWSIIDIIGILTDSIDPSAYWRKLKQRLLEEGNETVTNCHSLKLRALDGKMRLTDVADTQQVLRLIQSVPSKKAEPFKMWLAKVGSERIDETVDPELSIDRAIQNYRRLGYSENWINQRIKSIEVRKALTDEWDKSGVNKNNEYAALTDLMSNTWSGMTTREYKKYKNLKKENLRDNMTNTELVLNMLAEVAATDISAARQPNGFNESAKAAQEGAKAAKVARQQIEKSTGKS